MLDAATSQAGADLGLDLAPFYGVGRAGVLGDADPEAVFATLYFFPRELVVPAWRGRARLSPAEAVTHYTEACRARGRAHLADAPGLGRVCALGERVIAAAELAGRPLFAGWAGLGLPDDEPARAAQVLHVLREARGGLHIAPIMASGLTPLHAVLVSGGVETATMFGWPAPFPDVSAFDAAHSDACALTDRL